MKNKKQQWKNDGTEQLSSMREWHCIQEIMFENCNERTGTDHFWCYKNSNSWTLQVRLYSENEKNFSAHIKFNHRPKHIHTIEDWVRSRARTSKLKKKPHTHINGHNANCNKDYCMILKRTTTTTTFLYFFCKCVRFPIMYTIWTTYLLLLMDSPLSPCCYANGVFSSHLETGLSAQASFVCCLFGVVLAFIYFYFFSEKKNWVNARVKRL